MCTDWGAHTGLYTPPGLPVGDSQQGVLHNPNFSVPLSHGEDSEIDLGSSDPDASSALQSDSEDDNEARFHDHVLLLTSSGVEGKSAD